MYRFLFVFLLVLLASYTNQAFAAEPRLSTYREMASVIVDQRISNNVTASISLQTTSIQEFQVPPELAAKIQNNTDIIAVAITNEDQCVLGVQEQICVLVNSKREPGIGITETQQKARQIGDSIIGDINSAFGLKAQFHSVFLHYDDKSNRALETTGEISGAGMVSAVYTAPLQNTDFMFTKISGILIPRQIRQLGGFYDTALVLARDDSSRMAFTILPQDEGLLMQLKVSQRYPHIAKDLTTVEPLEFLKVDQLKKSDYFSVGFFPLSSLVQVVVLPLENVTKAYADNIIEPTIKNGERVPSDLSKNGWFFNSDSGSKIEAIYLFGEQFSASPENLSITFGQVEQKPEVKFDESYILIAIGVAAAGAAAYYLKGFRAKKN
ncbi:MAG: hypothetical protein WAO91_05185 [Candidatus Nitrosotenuis sp.]